MKAFLYVVAAAVILIVIASACSAIRGANWIDRDFNTATTSTTINPRAHQVVSKVASEGREGFSRIYANKDEGTEQRGRVLKTWYYPFSAERGAH